MSVSIVTVEMQQDVRRWVHDTLEKLGHSDLYVEIQWRRGFTARLGDARYSPSPRVRFSVPLWPRASEQDRRETVIHEVCHVIAAYENQGRKIAPHGYEWKALMRKCGVEPKVTHDVDRTGFTTAVIPAYCGCREHKITPYRAGQIKTGKRIVCRKCRGMLKLGTPPAHASSTPFAAASESKDSPAMRKVYINGRVFLRPAKKG